MHKPLQQIFNHVAVGEKQLVAVVVIVFLHSYADHSLGLTMFRWLSIWAQPILAKREILIRRLLQVKGVAFRKSVRIRIQFGFIDHS